MVQCNKFRICLITFILLTSSISVIIIPTKIVSAEDTLEDLFMKLSGYTPFITAGWYTYNGTETVKIKGDVTFDLYFTSTFQSQTGYKDDLKLKIYTFKTIGELLFIKEIENGNTSITLEPEVFGDVTQKFTVKIQNINHTMRPGDILIFTVEVMQSGKPIGNIIERRFEKNLNSRMKKIAEILNNSNSEEIAEIGGTIIEVLDLSEQSGITGEEIASLVNSFRSSSFVYNSADCPSSVYLSLDSGKNLTLYFHSTISEDFDYNFEGESGKDVMLENVPNGSIVTWPTSLFNLDTSELNFEEWMIWFAFWLEYIMMGQPSDDIDLNKVTYYLSNENKLVTSKPEGETQKFKLLAEPTSWNGISLSRNKIITNLTAELFLYYPKLISLIKKSTVNVTLFDDTTKNSIATDEKIIDGATLLEMIQGGPSSPTIFNFNDAIGKEIWYSHDLSLKISVDTVGLIDRPTYIFYNSNDYTSSVTLTLAETENIKIKDEELEDKEIIPYGSALYVLNISSKYADTIKIDVTPKDTSDLDNWDIEYDNSISIPQDGNSKVKIYVNSTINSSSAYDDDIELVFNVTGSTGFDSRDSKVTVSENAVDFDIEIIAPSCKDIKHGESGTYQINIRNRNTGFWTDNYLINVTSENDWDVTYNSFSTDIETYNDTGDEYLLDITVKVPEFTEISQDELTITIESQQSIEHSKEKSVTFTITTNVIKPNILEHIYNYFQGIAEDIGLDDPLGDYAGGFILFLVIFIILIFVIIIIYLLKKKYVEVICLDRIKEISPDDVAKFNITIKNPTNKNRAYDIKANSESSYERWDVSIDKEQTNIEPKQSGIIEISVKPNDNVKIDDWIEVKVTANMQNSKKSDKITVLTSVKDAKPVLNIVGVLNWPTNFKEGDKVVTSFRVTNTGNASANNVTIVLYINGEEKNKVEEVNIPRGGYAEIEIPWIAEKGKNEINIVVK